LIICLQVITAVWEESVRRPDGNSIEFRSAGAKNERLFCTPIRPLVQERAHRFDIVHSSER